MRTASAKCGGYKNVGGTNLAEQLDASPDLWVKSRREDMAEREGFEPPIALRLCLISSQVHSTGLCHLSAYIQFTLNVASE